MASWRDNLDKNLKPYVEKLIEESFNHKGAYGSAKDKGKAQLWIVLAILSRQLYNIELKLRYLERTLQDMAGPKLKQKAEVERKREEKEVEKFIKKLVGGKIREKSKKKLKKGRKRREKVKKVKRVSRIKIAKSL